MNIGKIKTVRLGIYRGTPSTLTVTWLCSCVCEFENSTCTPKSAEFCTVHTKLLMEAAGANDPQIAHLT